MAVISQDSFTAGSDENLENHTPNIGTGWTTNLTEGQTDMLVLEASDVIQFSAVPGEEGAREDTDVGDDDMDVSCTIVTTDNRMFIHCGRIPSGSFDAQNMYFVQSKASNP